MILALNKLALDELTQCFTRRAINHSSEDTDTVWDDYGVALIMKTPPWISAAYYNCTLVYKTILHHMTLSITPPATPLSKYQFVFRENHQAAECVFHH